VGQSVDFAGGRVMLMHCGHLKARPSQSRFRWQISVTVHKTIVSHGSTTSRRSPALAGGGRQRGSQEATFTWWPPSTSIGRSS